MSIKSIFFFPSVYSGPEMGPFPDPSSFLFFSPSYRFLTGNFYFDTVPMSRRRRSTYYKCSWSSPKNYSPRGVSMCISSFYFSRSNFKMISCRQKSSFIIIIMIKLNDKRKISQINKNGRFLFWPLFLRSG